MFSLMIEFQSLQKVFGDVDVLIVEVEVDSLLSLLVVPVYSYFVLSPVQTRSQSYNFLVLNKFSVFEFYVNQCQWSPGGISVGLNKDNSIIVSNGIPDWIIYLVQFSRRLQVLLTWKRVAKVINLTVVLVISIVWGSEAFLCSNLYMIHPVCTYILVLICQDLK